MTATGAMFDAIILAGGQASRLDGVDKPALEVAGQPMLASVIAAAARAGARSVIVVGPARPALAGLAGPGTEPARADPAGADGRSADRHGSEGHGADGLGADRHGADRIGTDWYWPDLVFVQEEPPGGGPVPALRRGLAQVSAPRVVLLAADLPFLRHGHLRLLLGAGDDADSAVVPGSAVSEDVVQERPGPGQALSGGALSGAALPAGALSGGALSAGALSGGALSGGALSGGAGVVLADDAGVPQWLTSCWPAAVLRAAAAGYEGGSLRGLLEPLRPVLLSCRLRPGEAPPWFDCDTPGELALARSWAVRGEGTGTVGGRPRDGADGPGGTLMTTLDKWMAAACAELGLDLASADQRVVLDLARDVAHGVERPAAPLTAYLLGVAVGQGADPRTAAASLTALAGSWPAPDPG